MIYFISSQIMMEQDDIRSGTIEQLLHYCSDKTELGLDIETTGLDPYTDRILCIQIGDEHNQFVIDTAYYPARLFKSLLEDESKLFLGHNIKFDTKFFLHERIVIRNVYDTYVSEQIVWNGYEEMKKSLDYVCHRYTGEMLDKSVRGDIHREGLSTRVIRYGASDVRVLPAIKRAQKLRAEKYHLINAIKLNNLFVPVMAYLEYSGFKLDTNLWQQKIDRDIAEMNGVIAELNQFILDADVRRFIKRQLDLFDPTPKVNINWSSSKQVTELFKIFNINVELDEDDEDGKESVSAKLLKKQLDAHPIIPKYIRYRELLKRIGTYGVNWYKFISPVTGRIHTKFQQWMSTGRMSSGGKDKDSKTKYINAQNIPSDAATRQCIIADQGNILINADYSSQEVRLFVDRCRDEALLKMFDDGYQDMHSYTAWYLFANIREVYPTLSKETMDRVKKEYPIERHKSKFANFAI
jgi:DNA polymerase I-like protein with 3'-5' exonuclease and polymerase domains